MPVQNPSGTADRPSMTAGSIESDPVALSEMDRKHGGGWVDRLEAMIERYPWPTLLIALSLGYMISRRMR